MKVVKRDGNLEEFDLSKIESAISKAFQACQYIVDPEVVKDIAVNVEIWDEIEVEDIQDSVIETLRDFDYDVVADAYATYRSTQSRFREITSKIAYQDHYISTTENAATSSETDGNANVVSKNVENKNLTLIRRTEQMAIPAMVAINAVTLMPFRTRSYLAAP